MATQRVPASGVHEVSAPVSGPRCRWCGATAWNDQSGRLWLIDRQTAYCPDCATEHEEGLQVDAEMAAERAGQTGAVDHSPPESELPY